MATEYFNEFIAAHLPSIHSSGITLTEENESELVVSAPLALNHNDHGNAFGGSIYNLALMACWATLHIECRRHIDKPNIVTRDGQIRYRHSCDQSPLVARCRRPNPRQWEGFFAHYEKTGKTSISLTSKIMNGDDVAAYFDGVFVLLGDTP